jgi:hypothetical protein
MPEVETPVSKLAITLVAEISATKRMSIDPVFEPISNVSQSQPTVKVIPAVRGIHVGGDINETETTF